MGCDTLRPSVVGWQTKVRQPSESSPTRGRRCLLNMQVTGVKNPLRSVARICAAGHTITFRPAGEAIVHLGTGLGRKFRRVDNVYRLRAHVCDSDSGFTRLGC